MSRQLYFYKDSIYDVDVDERRILYQLQVKPTVGGIVEIEQIIDASNIVNEGRRVGRIYREEFLNLLCDYLQTKNAIDKSLYESLKRRTAETEKVVAILATDKDKLKAENVQLHQKLTAMQLKYEGKTKAYQYKHLFGNICLRKKIKD